MDHIQSFEDYLERILMLTNEKVSVRSIDIANSMGFSRPSVSVAIKKLEEKDYVKVDHQTGLITLTTKGFEIASKTLYRHETLTEFFTSIGVNKKTAEEDACKIEHDLSHETFVALENFLNKVEKLEK